MIVERTIEDAMVTRLEARTYISTNSIPVRRYDDRFTLDESIIAIVQCQPIVRIEPNSNRYTTMLRVVALNNSDSDVEGDALQALYDDLFDEVMTDMTASSLNTSVGDANITIDGVVHELGAYDGGDKHKAMGVQANLFLTYTTGAALWTPAQITTALWLDASDATTITAAGGFVSQWDDKSGNSKHVTQGTGSRQPQTGVATISTLNALQFDGGDWLENATSIISAQPASFFCLFNVTAAAGTDESLFDGYSLADRIAVFRGSDGQFYTYAGSAIVSHGAYATGGASASGVVNGASSAVGLDGDLTPSTGDPGSEALSSGIRVGANAQNNVPLNGSIATVVLASSTWDTDTRQKVEGWAHWHWDGGVAGTLVGLLPAGHPYKSAAPTV
jgi:hypothetical protein